MGREQLLPHVGHNGCLGWCFVHGPSVNPCAMSFNKFREETIEEYGYLVKRLPVDHIRILDNLLEQAYIRGMEFSLQASIKSENQDYDKEVNSRSGKPKGADK